jgi:hypothetical protein
MQARLLRLSAFLRVRPFAIKMLPLVQRRTDGRDEVSKASDPAYPAAGALGRRSGSRTQCPTYIAHGAV